MKQLDETVTEIVYKPDTSKPRIDSSGSEKKWVVTLPDIPSEVYTASMDGIISCYIYSPTASPNDITTIWDERFVNISTYDQ